jgi:TctA family transporter
MKRSVPIPLLVGSLAVLALAAAILFEANALYTPLAALLVIGFGLGYLLRRWWWPLAPALIAFTLAWMLFTHQPDHCLSGESECGEYEVIGAIVLVIYGAAAALAMAAGILTRRLSERATSLRRRSS